MPISALPDDVEALKRLVLAREADLADARARQSSSEALIAHLRLTIEKMRRDVYGQRSERGERPDGTRTSGARGGGLGG